MKRRKFLAIAGLGGVVAAFASFKFVSTSFEEAAIKIIQDELSYLKLDPAGLNKFVEDYSKNKNSTYRISIRGYSFFGIRSNQSGKVNQLVTAYLLSTDFFINKMDESRVIKYIGLYDPYLRPCAHPFSSVFYS